MVSAANKPASDALIKFGTPDDYLQLYLPELAKTSSQDGCEIHIVNELSPNLMAMVDSGELDLALFTDSSSDATSRISTQPLSWVSSPGFIHDTRKPFPLALFPKGCQVRDSAITILKERNISHQVVFSSIQFSPLLSTIIAGHAIGVFPSNATPPGLQHYRSHHLPALPDVNISLKLALGASCAVRNLASSIAERLSLTA